MRLTQEHKELQRTIERFVENEINPHVATWEKEQMFPAHALFKKMGDLGLLGLTKPEEFGGMGLDYSYSVVAAQALGKIHCGGVPMAIGVQTDMATPALARFGSDELRREFLAPAVGGARKDGSDYVINGSKMWITNSLQADWICLLANTSEGKPHQNKSLIIVPMKTPGITIEKKIHKIGMWASDTGLIHFDNVRVPQRNLIGMEGAGFMYQMIQFQEERLWGAANSIEGMMHVLNETINYTRQRNLFGSTVLDQQVVHFTLAELKTEIEALRALVWQATEEYVAGGEVTELASMCKLRVSGISG